MTDVLGDDVTGALSEIVSDPSLPVATTLSGYPGLGDAEGRRIAALREAHDYLTSRRIAAAALESDAAAAQLLTQLKRIDGGLARALRWHVGLVRLIASLPPSRARNAALGDVSRGELLTWAATVNSWSFDSSAHPVGKVDAEFVVDEYPGLYDAILVWRRETGLAVLPTHRERLSWEPAAAPGHWVVRVSRATVHADEVIPLTTAPDLGPQNASTWREEEFA